MRSLKLATLFGCTLLVVLLVCTEMISSNPLSPDSFQVAQMPLAIQAPSGVLQSRVGMVQTLTCTNPTCSAQCRGRGYRRGSCTIGRCFCSYV